MCNVESGCDWAELRRDATIFPCVFAYFVFFSYFSMANGQYVLTNGELSPQDVLNKTLESQQRSDFVRMEAQVDWTEKHHSFASRLSPIQKITFEFSRDHNKINMFGEHLFMWPDGSNKNSFRFRRTTGGELATDYKINCTTGETKPKHGMASHNTGDSRLRFLFLAERGNFLDGYMPMGFTDSEGRRISELMLESPHSGGCYGKESNNNHRLAIAGIVGSTTHFCKRKQS